MTAPQRFPPHEAFECLEAEGELLDRETALAGEAAFAIRSAPAARGQRSPK